MVTHVHANTKRRPAAALEATKEGPKVNGVNGKVNGHAKGKPPGPLLVQRSAPAIVAVSAPPLVLAKTPLVLPQKGPIKGSIIKPKYKAKYKANGDYSCGDDIACELREYVRKMKDGRVYVDLRLLKEVAVTNGVWNDRYTFLNAGQQRMTIGNKLRHKYANGDKLDIGGVILFDPALQE